MNQMISMVRLLAPEDSLSRRDAQALEVELYTKSGSYQEYSNLETMPARYFHRATVLHHSIQRGSKKRCRSDIPPLQQPQKKYREGAHGWPFEGHTELLRRISEFLPTSDIIRLTAINHSCASILPQCVVSFSIHVACSPFALLDRFRNIETLQIGQACGTPGDRYRASQSICTSNPLPDTDPYGESFFQLLADAMKDKRLKKMKRLVLKVPLYDARSITAFSLMVQAFKHCPDLEQLDFSNCALSDSGSRCLARYLSSSSAARLRILDLRQNFIGEIGMREISLALHSRKSSALETLLLGGNIIADTGTVEFSALLANGNLSNLRVLALDRNFIRRQGVSHIANALQKSLCPTLEYLDFGFNCTEDGAVEIAKLVELNACPKLSLIDAGNVSQVGADAINTALRLRTANTWNRPLDLSRATTV